MLCYVLACFSELYVNTTTILVEVDVAVNTCVDGVILAHVYIVTRVPLGATLTDDDVTCDDGFATELFNAETITA